MLLGVCPQLSIFQLSWSCVYDPVSGSWENGMECQINSSVEDGMLVKEWSYMMEC